VWGSSIEGEGRKRKGIHKGEFFPPYTEKDAFSFSVVFVFSVFNFLLLGIIKGHSPFIVRGYKGVLPLRKVFSFSVVFESLLLYFSSFNLFGGYEGEKDPPHNR